MLSSVITGISSSIISIYATYFIVLKREKKLKYIEIRIENLSLSYEKISRNTCMVYLEENSKREIEEAISIIYLYGESPEIYECEKCINSLEKTGEANFSDLLLILRKSIRDLLNLKELDTGIKHLRMK